MSMSIEFPQSRISHSGQCQLCKGYKGFMQNDGRVHMEDENGKRIELLKWTCNNCGHTMLFDMEVVRKRPLIGQDFTEILPD